MNFVFVILINSFLSIVFAVCISYCESHKVRFIVNSALTDKNKMKDYYLKNEEYQLLVKQYNQACEEWNNTMNNDANLVAKFCMSLIVFFTLFKNALLLDRTQRLEAIISILIPILILLLLVYFVDKNNNAYIKHLKNGSGQKTFPAIFSLFMNEIDKYSYIENTNELELDLKSENTVLFRLTERIEAIKKLQRLEHNYMTHWLMCTTVLATLSFMYTIVSVMYYILTV